MSRFHQLDNNPVYKLKCRLFEYSSEDLATGIDAVDAIEDALTNLASDYQFTSGTRVLVLANSCVLIVPKITQVFCWGRAMFGYSTLQIPDFGVADTARASALGWANASMDVLNGTITGQSVPYVRTGAEGQFEIWVYVTRTTIFGFLIWQS